MEQIRKKGIIGIGICLLLLVISIWLLVNQNWTSAFQGITEIENIIELNECKEGQWIRIKFHKAYPTEYWKEEQGEKVAQFIDIEVNGQALIALVGKEEAERILANETEELSIEGVLQNFQGTDKETELGYIKENYLEDFSEELSEEEILAMFTPLQLLNYGAERPNVIWIVTLLIGSIGVGICLVIAIVCTVKPIRSRQDRREKD